MQAHRFLWSLLAALAALAALAGSVPAQSWSFPLDPRRTYLRTHQDSPLPPLVLDLASLGITPGAWLRVGTTGAFRYINGGSDTHRSLCAVFSADATLLATSVQQRVPGAIAAGPHFSSGTTYYGSLPMDVPQDFFCSRALWDDRADVQVPAGAAFLFVGVHDSLFHDNVDPNGDYGVVVTVLPPPLLPGTGEHLTLWTGVDGAIGSVPALHVAPAGSTVGAELRYPLGLLDGAIAVLFADTEAVGAPVPQPLPRLWLQDFVVLRVGVLANTPGWVEPWSLVVPPGLLGTLLLVQGGALSPLARNGVYSTTNAHAFVLQ
jgi:hypothetical protein